MVTFPSPRVLRSVCVASVIFLGILIRDRDQMYVQSLEFTYYLVFPLFVDICMNELWTCSRPIPIWSITNVLKKLRKIKKKHVGRLNFSGNPMLFGDNRNKMPISIGHQIRRETFYTIHVWSECIVYHVDCRPPPRQNNKNNSDGLTWLSVFSQNCVSDISLPPAYAYVNLYGTIRRRSFSVIQSISFQSNHPNTEQREHKIPFKKMKILRKEMKKDKFRNKTVVPTV